MPAALAPIAWGLVGGAAGNILGKILPLGPLGEVLNSAWSNLFPVSRTPADVCIRLAMLGLFDADTYTAKMRHHGYGPDVSAQILTSALQVLDAGTLIRAGWREGKTDETIVQELVTHGWQQGEAARLVSVSHPFPTMSDLVTWAAHEVYEEDLAQRYGLDDELGALTKTDFYKAGMTDEQIKNYWRAHWVYPAYTQVAEMMHRGLATEEEMWTWFRLAEITPYWRDKLIGISYNPYTRVDVRRMHSFGVLSDEELIPAYKQCGYDEDKARHLAEFTLAMNAAPDDTAKKDLTRASLEKARRYGLISPAEFAQALLDMGYSEDDTALLEALITQDVNMEQVQSWITILRNQVKAGLITAQAAGTKLTTLGLASEMVSMYVELFQAYAEEPDKIPAKSDVKEWLKKSLISEAQARSYLQNLGYPPAAIDLYILSWTPPAPQARPALAVG